LLAFAESLPQSRFGAADRFRRDGAADLERRLRPLLLAETARIRSDPLPAAAGRLDDRRPLALTFLAKLTKDPFAFFLLCRA
jgi:hypothetical protein